MYECTVCRIKVEKFFILATFIKIYWDIFRCFICNKGYCNNHSVIVITIHQLVLLCTTGLCKMYASRIYCFLKSVFCSYRPSRNCWCKTYLFSCLVLVATKCRQFVFKKAGVLQRFIHKWCELLDGWAVGAVTYLPLLLLIIATKTQRLLFILTHKGYL